MSYISVHNIPRRLKMTDKSKRVLVVDDEKENHAREVHGDAGSSL